MCRLRPLGDGQISVLILAGGQSRRMGQDKSWIDLDGATLVEHVALRLSPIAAEIIFGTNHPARYLELGRRLSVPVRIAPDRLLGAGPLAGLEAGLNAARSPLVLAVASDMPLVHLGLLRHMIAISGPYEAVIPRLASRDGTHLLPEPLHAVYRRSCGPTISRHLDAGARRLISFLPDLNVRYVDPDELTAHDPRLRSFANANTPDDLKTLRALIGASD